MRRLGSRYTRASRKSSSGQCSTTPAFMNSPRSTRGITRRRAYSNNLLTSFLQRSRPGSRFREAGREVIDVGGAHLLWVIETGLVPEPFVGDELHHSTQRLPGEQRWQGCVGLRHGSREGEQNVVADRCVRSVGHGSQGRSLAARPVVVEIEGRPVVYKPQLFVPDEQVRVARGAVDVLHERVEPQDASGERGSGASTSGSKPKDPGRKSSARLRPPLARIRSCISRSGSVRASFGSRFASTISGTLSPRARASSPTTSSATSALRP